MRSEQTVEAARFSSDSVSSKRETRICPTDLELKKSDAKIVSVSNEVPHRVSEEITARSRVVKLRTEAELVHPAGSLISSHAKASHPGQSQEVEIEEHVGASNIKTYKNRLSLTEILLLDNMAAVLTSLTVAPTVAIIDKAIVAHAGGVHSIGFSLATGFKELFTRPVSFIRHPSVLLTAMVYAGTFGTANSVDSIYKKMEQSSALPKFFASSAVNLGLSLFKDRAFTVWYSGVKPRPVTGRTLGLFALRDALTMAASFTLPPILATAIYKSINYNENKVQLTHAQAEFWSQITLPCAMQFVTTPVHLAAIDIYARPSGTLGSGVDAWKRRIQFIFKDYAKNVTTRVFRILPAFGLGGNMNRSLRNTFQKEAEKIKNSDILLKKRTPEMTTGVIYLPDTL